MIGSDEGSILDEIRREQARLFDLDVERRRTLERIAVLRARLAPATYPEPVGAVPQVAEQVPGRMSAGDKIQLFRQLFRGREDVFPRRWENAEKGRAGYAPACSNEWKRHGVCEKPRVKCGECPNQGFTPVSDEVIRGHLEGRYVMGVYPMLADETCWFLAADFDKASWRDDVASFAETCRRAGVPVAVERSRSGNGAHVWFFFSAPVAAATARRMGCYLITETMARRHQLAMGSYDRLFPNQDTMPAGGFGNLIALVAEDALAIAPQPEHDEILVLGRWVVGQSVDSPTDPSHAPGPLVLRQELG